MGFIPKKAAILVVLVAVVAVASRSHGLSICKLDENGLQACKPAVTKPEPVPPTADCCQALTGADLSCLCSYKESPMLPALGIDPDLCMGLPAKCNLPTPANC